MSLAITHAAREQQSYTKEIVKEESNMTLPFALQDGTTSDNLDDDENDIGLEW